MSESLKRKVRDWLDKHGGPVELRTARAFQQAGFDITQGSHFVDLSTGKTRETDLVAHRHQSSGGAESVTISTDFLIECKRSRHPWVAFSIEDHELNRDSSLAPYTWIMDDEARRRLAPTLAQQWGQFPGIYDDGPTAYSISVAKLGCKGDEAPFNAASQLLDAVAFRMQRRADIAFERSYYLIFPILVVDGPLFQYSLTGEGDALEEREVLTLVLRDVELTASGRRKMAGFARVKVVSLNSLADFAERAIGMSKWICDQAGILRESQSSLQEGG